MDGGHPFLPLALALLLMVTVVLLVLRRQEHSRQQKLREAFLAQTEAPLPTLEQRAASRQVIPQGLDITLTFTDPSCFGLKARVCDLSLHGLGLVPQFPLRRLPLNQPLSHALLDTPLGPIDIERVQVVRYQHRTGHRALGLEILSVGEQAFSQIHDLLNRLDRFSHDHSPS